MTLSCQIKQKC